MRVKCLAQEHNTMSPARARTRTARSGDERTNHEASAPPHAMLYGKGTTLSQPLVQALKINNFISSWRLQVPGYKRLSALQNAELLLFKKKPVETVTTA